MACPPEARRTSCRNLAVAPVTVWKGSPRRSALEDDLDAGADRVGGERQGLLHAHPGAGDAGVGHARAGQALGEGLDQRDVTFRRHGLGRLQDGFVVQGVGEPLGAGGGDVQLHIDDQRLHLADLVAIDADASLHIEAGDEHLADDDPGFAHRQARCWPESTAIIWPVTAVASIRYFSACAMSADSTARCMSVAPASASKAAWS